MCVCQAGCHCLVPRPRRPAPETVSRELSSARWFAWFLPRRVFGRPAPAGCKCKRSTPKSLRQFAHLAPLFSTMVLQSSRILETSGSVSVGFQVFRHLLSVLVALFVTVVAFGFDGTTQACQPNRASRHCRPVFLPYDMMMMTAARKTHDTLQRYKKKERRITCLITP